MKTAAWARTSAELAQRNENVEGMVQLGYPPYFMTILGVWKVFGTIAVLVPRFPRVKEWTYAGFFFNMTGAAVSHAVSGDAAWHVIYTGFLAVVVVASWALRPRSRILGSVLPSRRFRMNSPDQVSPLASRAPISAART